MNRIQSLFKKSSEKLIPFFTAGYPQLESTVELVLSAVDAGADMIEIGIPYSDPQADGPIIQHSSQIALDNGITIKTIFSQVEKIRKKTDIPIALMSYYNPILRWGHDKFLNECVSNGVDGLILSDLPYEEAKPFCEFSKHKGISPIMLIAPNTNNRRIKKISNLCDDLVYVVSILGITGNRLSSKNQLSSYLNRVRDHSVSKFVVGFGITSREDVKWFNKYSDGAVVGSAIIKNLAGKEDPIKTTYDFITSLKG